ncbi:MAG: PDZ domain-containing protein [Steroidobacteraceae bacterium]
MAAAPAAAASQASTGTLLLRQPTLSRDRLVFVYGGDLWIADRSGANPRQLTAHPASEFAPKFSPDGRWVAFSASYDGNTDVYVVPSEGGQPRRLTWHPAADVVSGWSADGQRVLFASPREVANNRSNQLFEVPLAGGFERRLMEAVAWEGAWSPDGRRLAYRPYNQAYAGASGWRQHRGGSTPPVWIIDPASNAVEKLPHENASDTAPAWAGDDVLFLSDRNDGAVNLFAWDTRAKSLRQLTHEKTWDIRSFAVEGRTVVYERGGQLVELDLASGATHALVVHIAAQSAQARPQWKDATRSITAARLSPTGKRVVLTARGDVFTVPVKDGSTRNLTASAGARESDALWSPDGERIAWLSDAGSPAASLRQVLVLRDQAALKPAQTWPLGSAYYSLLGWSPDGRRIVYQDNHLNLFAIAVADGRITKIATTPQRSGYTVAFSPDGRWLAYTIAEANLFSQVHLYDFESGRAARLGDGLSQTDNPAFGPDGLLYFTASVNTGPAQFGLDMSTQERPVRSGIYVAVLAADGKSPLLPKPGDEEPAKADDAKAAAGKDKQGDGKPASAARASGAVVVRTAGKDAGPTGAAGKAGGQGGKGAKDTRDAKGAKPVRVDFDGLQRRIVALPVAERNYDSLGVASDGALFFVERRQPGVSNDPPGGDDDNNGELYRFDPEKKEAKSLKQGIAGYSLSGDGKKLLLRFGKGRLEVGDAGEKPDAKPLELAGLRSFVDPREEWRQIFEETWWMEKEFFYDANLHGLDWAAVRERYRPLLAHVQRREDLNELLVEMIGELQVGHNRVGGGDTWQETPVGVGLLGADYELDHDRVRIRRIYRGDRWNPFLKAPLAAPGVGVREGDYLLAVNGRPLDARGNVHALFEGTVGKQVTLGIAADPAGKDLRNVTVEPVGNEVALRQWAWVERNRERVEQRGQGRIAYVYMPNTADAGFQYFNRLFFAQIDKDAVIVDDRRNGGGQAANYVLDVLRRPFLAGWKQREGLDFLTPAGAIYGPKLMLIDQDAGSGGDFMPFMFQRLGIGPLLGKRTWGGLIGISFNPPLIDGATLTVPFFRLYTPEGQWRIENEGVAPDIDVELEPDQVNRGIDTQLDRAIDEVLQRLKDYKPPRRTPPPVPTQLGR